jgi:hypothetical protein
MGMRARQGGWAGLIGLVLALVIVALLVKTVMGQMGLLEDAGKAAGGQPGHVSSAATAPATAAEAAAVTPAGAMERARGLEQAMREQARENAARIDKETQ